jgi:hypothetical protein
MRFNPEILSFARIGQFIISFCVGAIVGALSSIMFMYNYSLISIIGLFTLGGAITSSILFVNENEKYQEIFIITVVCFASAGLSITIMPLCNNI